MKIVLSNLPKHQRRKLWPKMVAGEVQVRWTKTSVRIKGRFASKFIVGAWFNQSLVPYGPQFDTLDDLTAWCESRGLKAEHGTEKAA